MRNPDSLQVSHIALDVADAIYDLTASFPRDQRFELTSQMRRAAISIGSNIYEACGQLTRKGFIADLGVALGSASELRFQLRLARRRRFAPEDAISAIERHILMLIRKLARLIAANRSRAHQVGARASSVARPGARPSERSERLTPAASKARPS